MKLIVLLAERNEEINNWLDQNPLVLGLVFLVLGAGIGGWGVYELMKGVAYGKYGNKMSGNTAKVLSIVRIVVGAGCLLFGLYKMVLG